MLPAIVLALVTMLFALTGCVQQNLGASTTYPQSSGTTTSQAPSTPTVVAQTTSVPATSQPASTPTTAQATSASATPRPTPTVNVTAGLSTAALPGTIPLPAHTVLVEEYATTLNAHAATAWIYDVAGSSATPANVLSFYKTNMPANGWAVAAMPSQTAKYGGGALAYTQNSQICTITAGVSQRNARLVALAIVVNN